MAGIKRAAPRTDEKFGHPTGLWVCAATELWDRISFHGLQSILTLYLASTLLVGDGANRVAGLVTFRGWIESLTGPLTPNGFATQLFGIYIALVYATPIVGGWIGDRLISRKMSVTLGALLMTLGHFSLAFDVSFLLGLLFLATGAGLLRGNLSPQVKALYRRGDRRQGEALQLYALSVNFGAFVAPLVTGALAVFYGWHLAFGFAGFGMLTGLIIYLAGGGYLATDPPRVARTERPRLSARERRRIVLLLAIWPLLACFWIAQSQVWNTYNLWVRDQVDLNVAGFMVPVPWLQSLDGLMPAISLPFILALWRYQARRRSEPELLTKMGLGCLLFAAGVLLLAAGSVSPGSPARTPLGVPIAFHMLSNLGWVFFSPVAVTLFLTRAPESTRGAMYGVVILAVTGGSLVSGRLGSLYDKLPADEFWFVHAAIVGSAGVAFLLLSKSLGRSLPEADEAEPLAPKSSEPILVAA